MFFHLNTNLMSNFHHLVQTPNLLIPSSFVNYLNNPTSSSSESFSDIISHSLVQQTNSSGTASFNLVWKRNRSSFCYSDSRAKNNRLVKQHFKNSLACQLKLTITVKTNWIECSLQKLVVQESNMFL